MQGADQADDALDGHLFSMPMLGRERTQQATGGHDAYFDAAAAILATAPITLDGDLLADVLAREYGLSGRVDMLSSEVESTAEVVLPDTSRLILKASSQLEAIDSFRFQSAAIHAVEAAPGFVSPRIVPTVGGELMFRRDGLWGYLQTRLPGEPLYRATISPGLLHSAGRALAHLDLALGDRDLPAVDRPVLWHIHCWPRLVDLQHYLAPGPIAEAVRQAMSDYLRMVAPKIGEVDWQVTHNDPSPFNTLVADAGVGFIDFGDGCWGPRIQDLAIAASHVVSDPALPLGGAESLIAGYASVIPLTGLETDLLVGLMKARQSALILVNHWRAHLFPENAPYITKNVARAERGLSILGRLGAPEGRAAVVAATSPS